MTKYDFPKMNPEVKTRWIEALNSGLYPQGVGWLNKEGKFCCLGVLWELAEKEGVVEVYDSGITARGYKGQDGDADDTFLPKPVAEWAGIPMADTPEGPQGVLSHLNDDGLPFAGIAKIIEEFL